MNFIRKNSGSATGWVIGIVLILIVVGIVIYLLSQNTAQAPTTALNTTPAPQAQQATTTASTGAPMIPYYTLALKTSPTLGSYLTAANGMTLYVYAKDSIGKSACTGICSTLWPPYTVASSTHLTAAAGITGAIGTITRSNGTTQVTYKGLPLYFWSKDTAPGNTSGNGIKGVWAVAKP